MAVGVARKAVGGLVEIGALQRANRTSLQPTVSASKYIIARSRGGADQTKSPAVGPSPWYRANAPYMHRLLVIVEIVAIEAHALRSSICLILNI